MLRIHAGHPPPDLTEKGFTDLFAEHGRVRSMDLAGDIFSSRCHGFGFIEMEGHEARVAISALNGLTLRGNCLRVTKNVPAGGMAAARAVNGRHSFPLS
jgi:RNA recognition motif-containing protein